MEAPSKAFLLLFLLPDWLKLNHLKSRMECGFSDIFSRHFRSTVAETIGVTNCAGSFGAKKCSENHIWSCWDNAWSVEPIVIDLDLIGFQIAKLLTFCYDLSVQRLIVKMTQMSSRASSTVTVYLYCKLKKALHFSFLHFLIWKPSAFLKIIFRNFRLKIT